MSRLDDSDGAEPVYHYAGELDLKDLQTRTRGLVPGNHRQRAIEAYEQDLAAPEPLDTRTDKRARLFVCTNARGNPDHDLTRGTSRARKNAARILAKLQAVSPTRPSRERARPVPTGAGVPPTPPGCSNPR